MDLPNVKGLDALNAAFRLVTFKVWRNVLRKGASVAARVIRQAGKAAAPVRKGGPMRRRNGVATDPGNLKANAFIKLDARQSNQQQVVYAAGFKGISKKSSGAFYGIFVERGHKIVPRRRKNAPRGTLARLRRTSSRSVPPHPFFEPAAEGASSRAAQAGVDAMANEFAKITR